MFTGLIERMGILERRESRGEGATLTIRAADWPEPLRLGDSVAVEGVCLTVTRLWDQGFTCDALQETLTRTTLGEARPGAPLNLERALRADGRLGGHFVTGHVDGMGRLAKIDRAGPDWVLAIEAPSDLADGLVFKGSVAVNGVSLTVAQNDKTRFFVHLIPHTWAQTTLHHLKSGDRVNLETDLLGKYVKAFLAGDRGDKPTGGLTWEQLRDAGMAP